jgi:hypothetical protein
MYTSCPSRFAIIVIVLDLLRVYHRTPHELCGECCVGNLIRLNSDYYNAYASGVFSIFLSLFLPKFI